MKMRRINSIEGQNLGRFVVSNSGNTIILKGLIELRDQPYSPVFI
jgi:hypothetical protein